MRTPRRTVAALLLGGLLGVCAPLTVGAAHADPLGDARAKAARLRTQVDALRTQAEIATEAYDEAYAKLGAAVTAHLTAERDLELARTASGTTDDVAARRVRALYMSGGTAALYAHVLDSASISEVANRVTQVQVVLSADDRASKAAAHAVSSRHDAERRLAAAAAASTALQKEVSARSDAVATLLARTDALLASADQQVLALAEQQRREAAQRSAQQAAAALAAARALLGNIPEAAPTAQAAAALEFAKSQVGKPYVWGATGPDAYDCSGLTGAAYAAAGVPLPRTSREQWYVGQHVELGALQPGDLLFWAYDAADPATIHHVAIYAGAGLMVAAPHSGDVVKVQPVYLDGYVGAVRPVSP
ncbi:MAG TPA: NlpC/P60 family protein [Mycobacteriales bacterium]|jgi:cell wall-associated NlpC family hydrolase|nr:NlpC/P60 family protein [Mycobacteriales bacterium]